MNQKTKTILLFVGLYLLSAGASFAVFSQMGKSDGGIVSPIQEVSEDGDVDVDLSGPKTAECPINGVMYTESQRNLWESRRPLVVMIENHEDSRPQSGLSRADVVYEAVAEGGISRFMGVYYCQATEPASREYDLGPVRSARTYFLDWASEYADYPLYTHVGGAGLCHDTTVDERAKALCQIEEYGWKNSEHWNDMDQFALSYRICRREPERTGKTVATEHTMYCDTTALWSEARERDLAAKDWDKDYTAWEFKDGASAEDRGDVDSIEFNFWEGYKDYLVNWEYDRENNQYLRSNAGEPHIDFLTGNPLAAKVVVVQFTRETGPVDGHKHMLYQTTGSGTAIVFQDGKAIQARWSKDDRQERTIFTDLSGDEIEFNRGQIWIEVLPAGNDVDYEAD